MTEHCASLISLWHAARALPDLSLGCFCGKVVRKLSHRSEPLKFKKVPDTGCSQIERTLFWKKSQCWCQYSGCIVIEFEKYEAAQPLGDAGPVVLSTLAAWPACLCHSPLRSLVWPGQRRVRKLLTQTEVGVMLRCVYPGQWHLFNEDRVVGIILKCVYLGQWHLYKEDYSSWNSLEMHNPRAVTFVQRSLLWLGPELSSMYQSNEMWRVIIKGYMETFNNSTLLKKGREKKQKEEGTRRKGDRFVWKRR